ncbi:MAG: hypothetical protein H6935_16390 [Thiobacillus sp.]|nr:hypothetical protein [Thiobacillus sp.]
MKPTKGDLVNAKRPTDKEESLAVLRAIADHLKHYPRASWKLKFGAVAIHEYLNKDHSSLEHAFGLVQDGPGRPSLPDGKEMDWARRALPMRINEQKSWKEICDRLGYVDTREMRRICKKYFIAVLNEPDCPISLWEADEGEGD